MAITNHERVGKALELLKEGLRPFVERELAAHLGKYWITEATAAWRNDLVWPEGQDEPYLDVAAILRLHWDQWNVVLRNTLGHAERSLVSELRDVRNRWAHQNPFSSDDAYRALDSVARLLTAVSAPEAAEVERTKMELLRVRFDEQVRNERRRGAGTAVESPVTGSLKPWREVVSPHPDVASGRYQQAEFAADLWQIHLREGTDEYRDPAEFSRRTFLPESLKGLLIGALRRLADAAGDPMVQLQTNFGRGKTHSMLGLYHLFSGVPTDQSPAYQPGGTFRGEHPMGDGQGTYGPGSSVVGSPKPRQLTRFHASARLDPQRVERDAGTFAREVLQYLVGLVDADAEITLEIEVRVPGGVSEHVVRTVTENCRTLKFTAAEFEES